MNEEKRPNRMRARSLANKLLERCGVVAPPVKLATVVKELDIWTVKGDSSSMPLFKKKNISAFIDLEEKILVYNGNDPVVRKRFSVAHEIGHYLFKHNVGRDIFNLNSRDTREIEANMFAAELLIPYSWIKSDIRSGFKIVDLAKKYWVSREAMGWRISNSTGLIG